MNKYKDPSNVQNIKEEIKNSPTVKEIKNIIDRVFPEWIKGIIEDYSDDYIDLKRNWLSVCLKHNTEPKAILLVDFISFHDDYSLIKIFCEIFTQLGFCVRSWKELFGCQKCGKALPQRQFYNIIKKQYSVPDEWRNTCVGCL